VMIDASKLSLFAVRVKSFAMLETVSLSDCLNVFNSSSLSSMLLIKRCAFGNDALSPNSIRIAFRSRLSLSFNTFASA
ncbi:hypothetical protein, partial [Acinetobacter geminorum]|uniref:hypothetical protein n=1 Tax=Acinetobacter geminorum TaxID=2730922 RepID=UPI003AF752C4